MGECAKCGRCCKYLVFIVPHQIYTQSDMDYFNDRGVVFERINRQTDREIVPCRCQHLGEDNLCKIWETRPDMCRKDKRHLNIWKPEGCTGED